MTPRIVEVRQKVLKQNDLLARDLRQRFEAAGVFVVSLASSPGSGKTAFLEKTLTLLRPNYKVAALVGDLATDNDAVRLARAQVPVKQITTGTLCHLEAAMIQSCPRTTGSSTSSTSCSSKTSATWSAPPPTTWARISASSFFPSPKARTNRSNTRPSSTPPTSPSSPKWTWPKPSSSISPPPRPISSASGPA